MFLPAAAAAVGALATAGVDIVEVLRGSTAGPLLVAAGAAGGAAAGAVLVTVATWLVAGRGTRAGGTRAVNVTAVAALLLTGAEVALLLADGASLGTRWLTAAVARTLVLLVFLERGGHRTTRDLLVLPLLLTALLGAPLASGATSTAVALLAMTVGLAVTAAVTAAVVALAAPPTVGRQRTLLVSGVALVVVALGLGVLSAPDPVPAHHQERIVADGLTFDLTIAPVRPGPNEAHLYAFGPDGRPSPVHGVSIAVAGAPGSAHELFEVSPDHHLSYALELPEAHDWQVLFQATGADGRRRTLQLELEEEGR